MMRATRVGRFAEAFSRAVAWGLAALTVWAVTCPAAADVRRRITVRSIPEGALVYIDDQQIGATPVSTSFLYYGTRKIQLIKDGFKTITVKQTFSPPWYEIPGIDFFSENVYQGELRDERVLDFQLEPETIPPTHELWQRAEALRASARAGPIAPAIVGAGLQTAAPSAPVVGAPGVFVAPQGVVSPPARGPAMRLPTPQPLPGFAPPVEIVPPGPRRLPP
jgi:hypothetical protein